MSRWPNRTGYLALAAFGAAAAAAVVVPVIVLAGDGDDDGSGQAPATATAPGDGAGTPAAGAATPTPNLAATATPGVFRDPEDALAAFVRAELESEYIGECPQQLAPGDEPPQGYCSVLLYQSEELATFNLGRFATDALGEAVLTRNEDGDWSLTFLEFPSLDAQISVGREALVLQAQDCLRFREAPSTSAEVLSCQIDGTGAQVVEGPEEADGHTWWRLEGLGWASGSYLAPVAE